MKIENDVLMKFPIMIIMGNSMTKQKHNTERECPVCHKYNLEKCYDKEAGCYLKCPNRICHHIVTLEELGSMEADETI